jgi:uncharacterized protein DUF742
MSSRFPGDDVGQPELPFPDLATDAGGESRHDAPSRRLRSFALTGGRTRSSGGGFDLGLETLVSVTVLGESAPTLSLERRTIVQLCQQPLSVAEVSAHLDVPLGVARVLLGDMAEEGLITVHRPAMPNNEAPDVALLQRVLAGLRTL